MSDTKPTPGALRAAARILNKLAIGALTGDPKDCTENKIATIIDRETHVGELLEALKGLIRTINSFSTNVDCSKAKAVIAAAEKEAADGTS